MKRRKPFTAIVVFLFLSILLPRHASPQSEPTPKEKALTESLFKATFEAIQGKSKAPLNKLVKENETLVSRAIGWGLPPYPSSVKGKGADARLIVLSYIIESFLEMHGKGPKGERVKLLRKWAGRIHREAYERRNRVDFATLIAWFIARRLYKESGDGKSEVNVLLGLAAALSANKSDSQAIPHLKEAVEIARKIGYAKGEVIAVTNLGLSCENTGSLICAVFSFGDAVRLARKKGDRKAEAENLTRLAAAWGARDYYLNAIKYTEQALQVNREIGNREGEGKQLGNLVIAYDALGEYRRAIRYGEQGLKIARDIRNPALEGSILHNLGMAYASIGDLRQAIRINQKSLKAARQNRDQRIGGPGLEGTLNNLAYNYLVLGEYRRAIIYSKKALALFKAGGNKAGAKAARGNLGVSYLLAGDAKKARELLEGADPLRKALYRIAAGRPQEAVSGLQIAINVWKKREGAGQTLFSAYVTLGRAHEILKNAKQAEAYYSKALALVEQEREKLTEAQREHFFGGKPFGMYNRLTPYEGLIRLSDAGRAFEYAEAMKARRLLEQAAQRESRRDPAVPDSLRTEEAEITRQFVALLKRKDSAVKRNDKKSLKEIEAALGSARSKRNALIARLYREAPEYAAIRYPRPLSVEEVQLKPGEVLIEFALTDTTLHAFLLRGNRVVKAIRKEIGRAEVGQLVEAYRRQLSEVANLSRPGFNHAAGYRLYALLLKDLLLLVRQGEEIIIVPDGKLALLPFEALPVSPEKPVMKQGRYGYFPSGVAWLGESYRIRYEQSASALMQRRFLKKKVASQGLFALADPVFGKDDPRYGGSAVASARPGNLSLMRAVEEQGGLQLIRLEETGRLADRLGSLFRGEEVDILKGHKATKANLLARNLGKFRHLVFATHGLLGGKVSGLMEPALVLARAGGKERDAFLTLSEAMTLRLNADVVALTACETGVGKEVAGEGVMGMGRAFQYAGAKAVLVSLWSVAEESTTLLVERFFRHLKGGARKVSALRQAREDVRRVGYRHPFFWAPFILIGD